MTSHSCHPESDRRRVLRREWKRYKPYLQKSISLPALQLIPFNRPYFTCQRCGFTNTYIPLCLWCAWTSEDAARQWDLDAPRPRMISAPTRTCFRIPDGEDRPPTRSSLESESAISFPLTSRNAVVSTPSISTRPTSSAAISSSFSDFTSPRVSVATSVRAETAPRRTKSRFANRVSPPTSPETPPTLKRKLRKSKPTPLTDRAPAPQRQPSKMTITPSTSASAPAPPRTLRHKKRMNVLRQRSSCSLRSRLHTQDPSGLRQRSSCSLRSRLSPGPATPSPAQARLGHPSRPYYTAIRKNMSPPASRPASPLMSAAASPLRAGFSLSGETELRIALAKATEGEFRVREMPLIRAAERKMVGNSVGGKVKKLGKGIRELVCGGGRNEALL